MKDFVENVIPDLPGSGVLDQWQREPLAEHRR